MFFKVSAFLLQMAVLCSNFVSCKEKEMTLPRIPLMPKG